MNYLLDTNVVSEWGKPAPDEGVVRWTAEADEDRLFLSVVALAELRRGMERLPVGPRRTRLGEWLDGELLPRFDERLLAIDAAVADTWGRVVARSEAAGRPIGAMDAFLAATAEVHDLTLVTRNSAHFAHLGRPVLNPWEAG